MRRVCGRHGPCIHVLAFLPWFLEGLDAATRSASASHAHTEGVIEALCEERVNAA